MLFHERILECAHDNRIVITVTYPVCNYPSVVEVKYGTEIDLPCLAIDGVLELRDIRKPFLVRSFGREVPIEDIVLNMLCILVCPCAAAGLPLN